jgi:hypothetical protein
MVRRVRYGRVLRGCIKDLVPVFVYPGQSLRLPVEICDHGFARGTFRKMFEECFREKHSFKPSARFRLGLGHFGVEEHSRKSVPRAKPSQAHKTISPSTTMID